MMDENRAKKVTFDSIKRAAKTGQKTMIFYLLNGRFPVSKEELELMRIPTKKQNKTISNQELLELIIMQKTKNNPVHKEPVSIPYWLFEKCYKLSLIVNVQPKDGYYEGVYDGYIVKSEFKSGVNDD